MSLWNRFVQSLHDEPVLSENRLYGSFLVLLAIIFTIATCQTTQNLWVLINLALMIFCNTFYVIETWGHGGSTYNMITTYCIWSTYLMYHWRFAIKYLECSFKIPKEVELRIIQPKTPIGLTILFWSIFLLIQIGALCKVWQLVSDAPTVDKLTSIMYIIPYFTISICCTIALLKIRSFFKSKGLGHRIDTCKIAYHMCIFMLFSVELVLGDLAAWFKWEKIERVFDMAFPLSLDTGDVVFRLQTTIAIHLVPLRNKESGSGGLESPPLD